jgi:exodeoxyribonuclease VII large subunit
LFEDLPAAGRGHSGVRVWPVGSLIRAIADSLEARFNPVAVKGELVGFSRAVSGHCYFNLKDEQGQVRCAMFRRAANLLDFTPRDGQMVELRGRLGVYEPRGELQLVVESLRQAGAGNWFEQFTRLKAKLEAEGLFDNAHKRDLPLMPRTVGVITSMGAAALHDVLTALQRRAPHVAVVVYPASVQGAQAAGELVQALARATSRAEADVLLLVRGGGALEDLWAFNDEQLARAIRASPIPVISGVGHETDFTIADFCADMRAPTPTAAAEMAAQPRSTWLRALDLAGDRLRGAMDRHLQTCAQRLDWATSRVAQPSHAVARERAGLLLQAQNLRYALRGVLSREADTLLDAQRALPRAFANAVQTHAQRLDRAQTRLELLDPSLVLQRGYAWLTDEQGHAVTSVNQPRVGQALRATLNDGTLDLTVAPARLI